MNPTKALEVVLDFVERWNKQDVEKGVAEAQGVLEEELHKQKCATGEHNMVKCDEWGSNCLYCGKYEA